MSTQYNFQDPAHVLLKDDVEKSLKANPAIKQDCWKDVGKADGIEIFRINGQALTVVPTEQFGNFFSNDCYIVLQTLKKEDGKLNQTIFLYLGKHTTYENASFAAYKALELDDVCLGHAHYHKELMGHETALFLALFPKFVFSFGQIEQEFSKVTPSTYKSHLFRTKGTAKTKQIFREVPTTFESLDQTSNYVLDAGLKIFSWNGKNVGPNERMSGQNYSQSLAQSRKTAKVFVLSSGDPDEAQFFEALGSQGPIAESHPDESLKVTGSKKLFQIQEDGSLKDLTDAKGRTKSNQLDSKHVFILDNVNRIYIYHGKIAPNKDKKLSINFAHKYLHSKNTPHVPISKCMEDYEIDEFKACLDEEGGRNFEIKKSEGSLNSLAKNDLSKSGNEISKFSKDNLKSSKDNLSSATNKAQ